MNILFVITRADAIGGAQVHVKDLAVALQEDQHAGGSLGASRRAGLERGHALLGVAGSHDSAEGHQDALHRAGAEAGETRQPAYTNDMKIDLQPRALSFFLTGRSSSGGVRSEVVPGQSVPRLGRQRQQTLRVESQQSATRSHLHRAHCRGEGNRLVSASPRTPCQRR